MSDKYLNEAGLSRLWTKIKADQAETLRPLFEAERFGPSGLVTFETDYGGLPLKACLVNIRPAQAGSGAPSPANVRVFSGWTDASVWRFGKNFFPREKFELAVGDGNGTVAFPHPLPAGPYTFSADLTSTFDGNCLVHIIRGDGTSIQFSLPPGTRVSGSFTSAGGNEIKGVRFYAGDKWATSINNSGVWSNVQVEAGLTATAYEPCEPMVFKDLPETVYSGTLDVLRGTLTVSHKLVTLTGQEANWTKYGADTMYISASSGLLGDAEKSQTGTGNSITGSCSICPSEAAGYIYRGYVEKVSQSGGVQFNNIQARWGLATGFTAADWKARLQELSAAGTPVQILYKLAAPCMYRLTPQLVSGLGGQNHIWADCGEVTVEYGAFLQALQQEIEAMRG